MPKPAQLPPLTHRGPALGPIELGRRMGGLDPQRALRFRVFPYQVPKSHVRLELAPTYHVRVVVDSIAENGYALGEVIGHWSGDNLKETVYHLQSHRYNCNDPRDAIKNALRIANYDTARAAKVRDMTIGSFSYQQYKYGIPTLPVFRYHTDEELLSLLSACRFNKSEMARCLGVNRDTVRRMFDERNLTARVEARFARLLVDVPTEVFTAMYGALWSLKMIADAFQVGYADLRSEFLQRGIPRRARSGATGEITKKQQYKWPKHSDMYYECTPKAVLDDNDSGFREIMDKVHSV